MANGFTSFLQHLGSVLKNVLHIGEEVAVIAKPFVAIAFPEILPLYSSALGLAIAAEATHTSGTGPQKLAQLVTSLLPQFEKFAADNGLKVDQAAITKWASAVVDTINLIPAPVANNATTAPVA